MKLDVAGYNLIKGFEGLKLSSYQDSAGIWTIGYGNITYENGTKVKKGDVINTDKANKIFNFYADKFAAQVDDLIKVNINQNKFNAIVSLAYNIGIGAFRASTLLKKININPNDATIKNEFLKWVNSGGRKVLGLMNRRIREAEIYFK